MKKKDIDKLFQEKLQDFREIPEEKVWRSIEHSLNQRKNSRRLVPIWWKLGGAAAILVIAMLLWNPFPDPVAIDGVVKEVEKESPLSKPENRSDPQTQDDGASAIPEGQVTSNEENTTSTSEEENFISDPIDQESGIAGSDREKPGRKSEKSPAETTGTQEVLAAQQTGPEKSVTAGTEERQSEERIAQTDQLKQPSELSDDQNRAIAEGETDKSEMGNEAGITPPLSEVAEELPEESSEDENGKKSIFDEIKEQEEEDALVEVSGPKWSVGPSIAPVYFSSFGDGSPIHSNFTSNSKTGNINMSYGVAVSYDVSKKLSLRSGIHKVDYGYNTNDIIFSSSLVASTSSEITNINYNTNSRNLVVESSMSRPSSNEFAANDIVAQSPSRSGKMVQEFGYLEVPMELNFNLLDRKLGVNLVGGISSLFLVNNSVTLESAGSSTEMGEANNLNDVNFSTNLGLGINYKISEKMKVHLEPVFKYQLNMFSDVEGSFQPYTLGVYTGMSFKF